MDKTFVKTLMCEVNNDDLPVLGIQNSVIRQSAPSGYFRIVSSINGTRVDYKASVENGHFIKYSDNTDLGTSVDVKGVDLKVTPTNYAKPTILKTDIYASNYIGGIVNFDELPMSDSIIFADLSAQYDGSISYYSTGDVKRLAECFPNLKWVKCTSEHYENDDIDVIFGSLINLEVLNAQSSRIYGALEDLAAAQVTNGRTSGTLAVTAYYVTYNGSNMTNATKTIKFGSSMENPTAAETAQGYQIV